MHTCILDVIIHSLTFVYIGEVKKLFSTVQYAYTTIPTYPSGQIGFIIASTNEKLDASKPSRAVTPSMKSTLRYYSSEIHEAAFVLPGK